jgi:2-isopropylmalate synthase
MGKILLLDTTLREGEQTPGVSFAVEQKLRIARALDEIGVDMIEVGHPNVSPDINQFIKEVVREDLRAEIVAHCRARDEDIEKSLSYGVDRVAIFLGTSKSHLKSKLKKGEDEASNLVYQAIKKARDHGVRVRFTAEDAPRTDPGYLIEICRAAIEAGADRIGLPDTVGNQTPDGIRSLFQNVRKEVGAELDAHCHNDLGLALANSLAAMEGGATCIHVTVNGLGERVGITSLCSLAVALKVIYDIDTVRLDQLMAVGRMVAECSGVKIPSNMPVIGDHAFSHKAGLHTTAVLKDPSTYEAFPPAMIGRDRKIVLDKFTGRDAVKWRLAQLGFPVEEGMVSMIVDAFKSVSHQFANTDDEFRELVHNLQCKRNAEKNERKQI